jgi:Mrp family chromosome partitioning ATPase
MARMIDAFRQLDTQREHTEATPTGTEVLPAITPATAELSGDMELAPEAMSFIEVGGKGKALEASADVLACPVPARRVRAPEAPRPADKLAPALVSLSPGLPVSGSAAPAAVSFEPWPASLTASRRVAPELTAYHQPEHPASKQYQALMDQLRSEGAGAPAQALLLTSAAPSVAATTICLNLAVCASARSNQRIAVVDLCLTQPTVAPLLGLLCAPGVTEVVAGTEALEQCLQATAVANLQALTLGSRADLPLSAEALRWMIACLRERFDVIFLSSAPWDNNPVLTALAPVCDAIYAVLTESEMADPRVQQKLHKLTHRGGRLRGLIHTQRAA